MKALSKEELIELVREIMNADGRKKKSMIGLNFSNITSHIRK